jgi:4-amino-4-deoxy-L-arabinose transferase-like glycosyltransferase
VKIVKKHYIFLIIFFVTAFLRLYRLDYLTTFGRDQGIDFLTIRDIIVNHKLTLIGIKVSLADFFQGPVYLYLLTPLFYSFKLNPLAGAITAVIISLLTITTLYYIVLKIFNMRAANLAAIFFAVSPQLVMFGNTPLYQNFTPLFILLGIWFLYKALIGKIKTSKQYFYMFLTGFFIGIGLELHFLVISLALALIIYLILFTKNFLKLLIFYFFGLIIAASPTIIFELKHNFLNIHLLINYLSGREQNHLSFLSIWLERLNFFTFNDYNFLIIVPLLFGIYLLLTKVKNLSNNFLFFKKISLITMIIIFIFAIKLSAFGTHYFLPLLMLLLIIIPAVLSLIKSERFTNLICIFFLGANFVITIFQLNNNHGYFMPDGWSLNKIEQTSKIISVSVGSHPNFNVASLLDGDTRTYPVRYMLTVAGSPSEDFTTYPSNNYLYVTGRDKKQIINSDVWEISSLRPFKVEQEWDMGDGIILFLLARIRS